MRPLRCPYVSRYGALGARSEGLDYAHPCLSWQRDGKWESGDPCTQHVVEPALQSRGDTEIVHGRADRRWCRQPQVRRSTHQRAIERLPRGFGSAQRVGGVDRWGIGLPPRSRAKTRSWGFRRTSCVPQHSSHCIVTIKMDIVPSRLFIQLGARRAYAPIHENS